MGPLPDFETTNLAEAIEALNGDEIDRLPFGVIGLDPQGVVRFFNKTEAKLSGYGERPTHGKVFFTDVAPCMNNSHVKGRIERARAARPLELSPFPRKSWVRVAVLDRDAALRRTDRAIQGRVARAGSLRHWPLRASHGRQGNA